ncbi:MAG: AmmeMemoRadiSam system radical SAM enzyme [Promethearchaeota archaeon]|jgi:pyruvate formate lyase activating enzyme
MNSRFTKKSKYQKQLGEGISQCLICERKCKISQGKSGFCGTRVNINGQISTIVYGLIPAISINPIEKKPLYHFYPGSTALTVGTFGCNFSCFWCQNHHISKQNPSKVELLRSIKDYLSPKELIQLALKKKCQGTSISFNEPTLLFEYSLEVFELAKKHGLYNTFVSNGYMTEKVLEDLSDAGLDAINIDIKGGAEMNKKYCGVDVEIVWRNAKMAVDMGLHVEITTLLIPQLNTDPSTIRNIARRIRKNLGENTPFHLSRFFPHYKSDDHGIFTPTPLEYLKKCHDTAKSEDLNFVYLGNMPTTEDDDTVCPQCSNIVIERKNLGVKSLYLDIDGNCKFCKYPICRV